MANGAPNGGISWRLEQMERQMERVRPMVERMDERVMSLQAEVGECRNDIADARRLIRTETASVHAHIDKREAESRGSTLREKLAVIGAVAVVLASVITAVTQVMSG